MPPNVIAVTVSDAGNWRIDMGTHTVSRRTVVAGAAWAVPAVGAATTLPAFAVSGCTPATSYWVASSGSTATASASGGVTAKTAANGSTYLRSANFSTVTVTGVPQYSGQNWLMLDQGGSDSAGQTVTITFPQPVYCVSFYVNDIDTQYKALNDQYADKVTVTGFTPSATTNSASNLTVSGNSIYPSHNADSGNTNTWEYPNTTSDQGLAKFSYTSSAGITQISLTYLNKNYYSGTSTNGNTQQVYISPISYSTTSCTCV